MLMSDIQPTLQKQQQFIQLGMRYLGSDKEKAKTYFRLASAELEKLQSL